MSEEQVISDEYDEEESIVVEARERFLRAEKAYSANRHLAVDDTKFAMGDSDNGWQWPDEVRKQRQFDKRVCLTVNHTAQHCNQIVNAIRQNRPSCRVLPVDDYADKKTAEILAGLIRNIQASSAADDAHDLAAEHAVIGGEGYWRIVTEYESDTSFDQVIKIKSCPNPQLVYIDPDCKELDRSDAEWGFIFEDINKETFKRDHPDIDASSWQPGKTHWVTEDTFRRAEYFYCNYVKDTALLLADGSSVLESNLPEGVTREGDNLHRDTGETIAIINERETSIRKWRWCKLVGGHDEPIDETDWPGCYLPIIADIGKELNVNGEIIRKGMVRDIKDSARMVNYSFSEAVQTLALQNKVPYMAAQESIEGFESIWGAANLENRAYLPFNAISEDGTALPMPQRQPAAVIPTAQIQMLQLSTEEMRGASGQQNANFGIKSEASSGIGIERLRQQGDVATYHFPDNHARALRYEAKVLIDLIQKVYDTRRVVRVLGLDGQHTQATLDPAHPQPYSEQPQFNDEEIKKIFNPSIGQYDVTIDTGPSFQTQRQEAFASLTDLAGRSPALMQIAGDIIMRAADFPMAEQLADRMAKALPPALQDQKGGDAGKLQQASQAVQQAQQQIQQMQQQMQEMQTKLQQAETGQAKVQAEIQGKIEISKIDAQIQDQKHQRELSAKQQILELETQAKIEQSHVDAKLALDKIHFESEARNRQILAEMQFSHEQSKESEEKKQAIELAKLKMEIDSKEEIAELNAYVALQKVGIDNPALTDDVNEDFSDDKADVSVIAIGNPKEEVDNSEIM